MANGEGHKILTHAAIETLPAWERELLSPFREKLENEYSMYGDTYFGDQVGIGPYIRLPDGRLPMDPWEIRHFRKDGPGMDYYICGYYDLMRCSFEYFAGKCIESLQSGKIGDFAKFAGSLAHVIEDCGAPPHAVGTNIGTDMKLIKSLFPSSDAGIMAKQFHTLLEGKYEPFSIDYTPQLLGTSKGEISFNLLERFTDMLENSIAQIVPMLDAFYHGNEPLVSRHLSASGKFSSKILADFLHSTLCAGLSRFNDSEIKKLETTCLSEHAPEIRSAWMPSPYQYAEIRKSPWSLNGNFEPVRLALQVNGKEMAFEKGYGLGPSCEINFILPENAYRRFSATVGIHNTLGAKTGIRFSISGDGTELAAVICKGISDSKIIEIDISAIKRLTLKTVSSDSSIPWPDNTHAVWGNPLLTK